MSIKTPAYAASDPKSKVAPFVIERREPGPHDVLINISYCGVCHSDIHQTRDEWGDAIFPMVPGHEIVGRVARQGDDVTKWKPGDHVGVSVLVDSCRKCEACRRGEEQYCDQFISYTYNGREQDRKTPTYGGYSSMITVDENYVLGIPTELDMASAAPLLCAGITTYSPLRHFGVGPGSKLALVGLGGLGHMGLKYARALGAEVTVVSRSTAKREDAMRMGAADFISTQDPDAINANARKFDFVLDTVSGAHSYDWYLKLLRTNGTMMLVGLPEPTTIRPQSLVDRRLSLAGSSAGSIRETQEMLQLSAEHGISADIEMVDIADINDAYERTISGDVRYRFVIDMKTLQSQPA